MQTPCLGWSREASSPGVHHSVSITFLPTPPKEGEDRCPRSWGPRDSPPVCSLWRPPHFRMSPLPQVSPFPGVSLLGSPTSGYPSLSGVPLPGPHGTRTDSRALTGPATGRSAGQSAAGASSGSARRTDPHSRPCRPAPRAGSDVHRACEDGRLSECACAISRRGVGLLSPPGGRNPAQWDRSLGRGCLGGRGSARRFRWYSW